MKAAFTLLRITLFALVVLAFVFPPPAAAESQYGSQIQRAVSYMESHYVHSVGLIYESEDPGAHWLKRAEYPDYQWNFNQTFWLYSDNLFAAYALSPFNQALALAINRTINSYHLPFSNKFEAIIGRPVGVDRLPRDVLLRGLGFAVLYRIHDGALGDVLLWSADTAVYAALSSYYLGHFEQARAIITHLASLWNGTCLVDATITEKRLLPPSNAATDHGFCPTFKVALLLYAARVTGASIPNFAQLEAYVWTRQQPNGGITTLNDGHGNALGSANSETTALTLLVYNEALISKLHNVSLKSVIATSSLLAPISKDQIALATWLSTFFILGIYLKRRRPDRFKD